MYGKGKNRQSQKKLFQVRPLWAYKLLVYVKHQMRMYYVLLLREKLVRSETSNLSWDKKDAMFRCPWFWITLPPGSLVTSIQPDHRPLIATPACFIGEVHLETRVTCVVKQAWRNL